MKKISVYLLTLCLPLVMCINAFAAVAEPIPNPIDGSPPSFGQDKSQALASSSKESGLLEATPEEMAYWAQKNAVRDALNPIEEDDDSGYTVFASWVPLSPFTYYKQEVNNTCTIACTRMAFRYVDGSTPSESTIKSTTGAPCSIDSAVKYFNNNTTSSFSYSARYRATKTTMKNDLYSTISNGAPPILGIHLTISDGWPFDLNVHAVAVYSIMSDKSEVALCDPWAGYIGKPDWRWYDKSADDLYSAYDAVNAGYMY